VQAGERQGALKNVARHSEGGERKTECWARAAFFYVDRPVRRTLVLKKFYLPVKGEFSSMASCNGGNLAADIVSFPEIPKASRIESSPRPQTTTS